MNLAKDEGGAGQRGIETLLHTALANLRELVDANTVVGDVIAGDGLTVVPVSRVSCGFLAGGGDTTARERKPLIGGSGAGIQINPVAFLVLEPGSVRLIPVDGATNLDKAIEAIPLAAEQLKKLFGGGRRGSAAPY